MAHKVQGAYMQEANCKTWTPLWLTQICSSLCLYALLCEIKKGAINCGTSVQNVQRFDRGVTEWVRIRRMENKVEYVTWYDNSTTQRDELNVAYLSRWLDGALHQVMLLICAESIVRTVLYENLMHTPGCCYYGTSIRLFPFSEIQHWRERTFREPVLCIKV
jgi:hypothetical protein